MQSWLASVFDMPLQIILEAPMNPTGCYAVTDADQKTHVVMAAIALPHAVLGPPVAVPQPQPSPPPPPPPAPTTMLSWIVTVADTASEFRVDSPVNPTGCWIIFWDGSRHLAVGARPLVSSFVNYPIATLGPSA